MENDPEDPPTLSRELLATVYAELRRLAAARLAGSGPGASLVPTELVHEAYLRLDGTGVHWDGPHHFFGAAAEAMRRILVDRARARGTLRRGSGRPLTLPPEVAASEERADELVAINEALEALEEKDPRLALVVKLRYFAGLTVEETATALEVAPRTVHRDWTVARAWLQARLGDAT